MFTECYSKENFIKMHSMHDSLVSQILKEDNRLIIIYDNLDINSLDADGFLYYKGKKLTVKYEFESVCNAILYKDNRIKYMDLSAEWEKFNKLKNKITLISYKFSVDSFGEITLSFSVCSKSKYRSLDIITDAVNITYIWE